MNAESGKFAALGPVLFPFTGAAVGGSHISTFTLARSLVRDYGLRSVVLAVDGSSIAAEAAQIGLDVRTIPGPPATSRSPVTDVAKLFERVRTLQNFGPGAILHCNDMRTLQSWGTAGKLRGIPVIYHHRAFERPIWPNRLLVRMAHAVICISEACRNNLAFLPDSRVDCILNPFAEAAAFDGSSSRAEFEARWPGGEKAVLIGFAANFQRRKRPEFFLETCRVLAEGDKRVRFLIFGRDRDYGSDSLSAYAQKLGLAEKSFFAGFRSPPERNLGSLDVLLAPALAEPFGRTLVEALLLGVPYVATDDAGHSEIFARWGGGRLVSRSSTPRDFADEVRKVLDTPAAFIVPPERRSEIARELAPMAHAAKVIDVYRRVAKAVRRPT